MNVTVIGTGGWGTALAVLLHGNGHQVALWAGFPRKLIRSWRRVRTKLSYRG